MKPRSTSWRHFGERVSSVVAPVPFAVLTIFVMFNAVLVLVSLRSRASLLVLGLIVPLGVAAAGYFLHLNREMNRYRSSAAQELLSTEAQPPLQGERPFVERLSLEIWVGASAEGDRIVETRQTTPVDPVTQHSLTPVHPIAGTDVEPIDIFPEVSIDDPEIKGEWVPIGGDGRGVVRFTPPLLGRSVRWTISYAVPNGLWDPLRNDGIDVFRYDLRTVQTESFEVKFMVSPTAEAVVVQERNNRGRAEPAQRAGSGWWTARWSAGPSPALTRFEWNIWVNWVPHTSSSAERARV